MSVDEFREPRIADAGAVGDFLPLTTAQIEPLHQMGFKIMCVHEQILAKLCYDHKQHITTHAPQNVCMDSKKPINTVLAESLAYFMDKRDLSQSALARLSGVGQTTISLYLNPDRRQPGKSGKMPSAKLSEVESLADALGVEVWELLRPMTPIQRDAYKKLEEVFWSFQPNSDADKSAEIKKAG